MAQIEVRQRATAECFCNKDALVALHFFLENKKQQKKLVSLKEQPMDAATRKYPEDRESMARQ